MGHWGNYAVLSKQSSMPIQCLGFWEVRVSREGRLSGMRLRIVVIKPCCEHFVRLCKLPTFTVVRDLRCPGSIGPVEEKIKLWMFRICEVASSELGRWEGGGCKLLTDPLTPMLPV